MNGLTPVMTERTTAKTWDGDPQPKLTASPYGLRASPQSRQDTMSWFLSGNVYRGRSINAGYSLKVQMCPVTEKCLKSLTAKPNSKANQWTTGLFVSVQDGSWLI